MPKLPEMEPRPVRRQLTAGREAEIIAAVLSHRTSKNAQGNPDNGFFFLGRAARRWLDENDDIKAQFVAWYEAQP
jgi:hypothetical protein